MSKIVSIRKVANGGLQGELQDTVDVLGRVNVLAKLNRGDVRFNTGSVRRAWFPVTLNSLEDLGINKKDIEAISKLEEGDKYELNFENPSIDGEPLAVQVVESIIPDAWQRQNTMKSAKQLMISEEVSQNKKLSEYDLTKYIGRNGYFLDEDGNYIFTRTSVTVKSQLQHVFIKGKFVPENELSDYGATLAEPINTKQTETV